MKPAVEIKKKENTKAVIPEKNAYTFSRRELIRGISGAIGLFALSGMNYSCICQKKTGKKPNLEEFWKHVKSLGAYDLVQTAIAAAQAQVGYSNHSTASERAVALLGEDAGDAELEQAREQFAIRTAKLQNTKAELELLVNKLDQTSVTKIDDFFARKSISQYSEEAKEYTIGRLVKESNILPDEAKEAMDKIDPKLAKLADLKSFDELVQHINQHLDSQIDKKFGNPGIARGLCLFLLLISSMYFLLIIVAILVLVLVCVLSLGFLCSSIDLQDIIDDMVDDICGPE
jgi:hypothetical protein